MKKILLKKNGFCCIVFAATLIENNHVGELLGVIDNRFPYLALVFLVFIPVAFGMKMFASSSSAKGWKQHLNYFFERMGEGCLLTIGVLLNISMIYGPVISAIGIYISIVLIPIKWFMIGWVAVEIVPLMERIYVKALAVGLKNQHFQ